MFIPEWVIWITGVLLWIGSIFLVASRGEGPYDFVAATFAGLIFVGGVAFFAGLLASRLF